MAISFAGLLAGEKGLAAEQAAAAKAQEDKEWRELIRQDSVDAKEQAQSNFKTNLTEKRLAALGTVANSFVDARRLPKGMKADLLYLKEQIGDVEGGNEWVNSFKNNPALIAKLTAAHKKADEKGYGAKGLDLIANVKIIGASETPESDLDRFASVGDIFAGMPEDITDTQEFYGYMGQFSAKPVAPSSSYQLVDPKVFGLNVPTPDQQKNQSVMWRNKMNTILQSDLSAALIAVQANPNDDAAGKLAAKLQQIQTRVGLKDYALLDSTYGYNAWNSLASEYSEEKNIFGNGALPQPPPPPPVIGDISDPHPTTGVRLIFTENGWVEYAETQE
tara:strand:- start:162 stop:1160 length:999 start_codon:yes stop_codon:yes gene_type:complete